METFIKELFSFSKHFLCLTVTKSENMSGVQGSTLTESTTTCLTVHTTTTLDDRVLSKRFISANATKIYVKYFVSPLRMFIIVPIFKASFSTVQSETAIYEL